VPVEHEYKERGVIHIIVENTFANCVYLNRSTSFHFFNVLPDNAGKLNGARKCVTATW